MRNSLFNRLRALMLPGLKRWILVILCATAVIVYGVFLVLGYHPIAVVGKFVSEVMGNAAKELPYRFSGLIAIIGGFLFLFFAVARVTLLVLGAYLPNERESIPDVLYRKRHLDRGPRVVVVGGGTGLSNLLKGLKNYTNNITAIVTVGDDGGSSGRLRQELGVLPPGDIRNCITALADEEKLVTELFRYRFDAGEGLEGHSFGNLFLTALCAITKGDMLEAVRTAGRVLNSCGQVLPSTLSNIVLVAEMDDGSTVRGESQITQAGGKIRKLYCEPTTARATPEAIEAIIDAELIIVGPGSLYTSIVPNLLIQGIADAIKQSAARKLYICNVMTQAGETHEYSVADHVQAVLAYAGGQQRGNRLLHAVLVNDQPPDIGDDQASLAQFGSARPVRYDPDRLRELAVVPVRRSLISPTTGVHHNPHKLAKVIMVWFNRKRPKRPSDRGSGSNRGGSGSNGSSGGTPPNKPEPTKSARERIASLLALLHLSPS
jgi:uncharacterized cofD-like protein